MRVTVIRKIESWVVMIAIAANVSGAMVLLALVAIMNVDVISRNLFNAPFRGVVEIVIFSLALIVFLQLPDVVRTGRLTRSDGFLGLMREGTPRFGETLTRFLDAVACVFMCLIVWAVWPEFTEAFESCHFFTPPEFGVAPTGEFWADFKTALARCDYFGTPGILQAPWWPVRLAVVFGCAWAAILFFFKVLLGDAHGTRHVTAQSTGEV
ncbi:MULTISPECIES: TRAP transporter small permease subunit [Halocynthiibacter]|uniref:TRAP transporter small permease protein n=1 Tax=Halocynthiibacter halioticoli TaxID=2986804 RepID=A0AAE3LRP6_9RHOB|nr:MULTISPECIES: TRAP transporter small permease [Halocynthiibacter]MCV6824833.1 TRAP transporter small permease [Halocynthiibacter halioticoli]MCW4057834.1 TRAP transporter small permease [Halocynthiibacter sp. SDUM655004]